MNKYLQPLIFAGLALVFSLPAAAKIVFDPTNFVQNAISASQAVIAEGTRVRALQEMISQKLMAAQNLKSLGSDLIAQQSADMQSQYEDLSRYAGVITSLYGNVSTIKNEMQRRYDEQRLSGMSWEAYMKNEAARVARGAAEAVSRAERNRRTVENMHRDFEQARRWQEQIGGLEGEKQSMQLMNAQMNKLVNQSAQYVSMMAAKEIDTANAQQEEAAERDAAAAARLKFKERRDAENAKINSEMSRLRLKSSF